MRQDVAVFITTRNRRDIFDKTITQWAKHAGDIPIFVVDDASDVPLAGVLHRFEERVGIARAKNYCLKTAWNFGIEHIFLVDDDTYPIRDDWWLPYVQSPEPHLMHIFTAEYPGAPKVLARDPDLVAWTWACGDFLYVNRSVLEKVGGYDEEYGTWGHEHIDYSNRIHNAGLTTFRFQDVSYSAELIHCMDEVGIERSVGQREREKQLHRNVRRYQANELSSAYKPFRTPQNLVLTSWLSAPDPQRRGSVDPRPVENVVSELHGSVSGADVVVLSDDACDVADLITDWGLGPYLSRWVNQYQWLREHPEYDRVFCVDAGDVQMLHEPWKFMRPGFLYVGYEPVDIAGNQWMHSKHPSRRVQAFLHNMQDVLPQGFTFNAHRTLRRPLLNCGVVGGYRDVVLEFLHDMVRAIEDNQTDHLMHGHPADVLEMGMFNMLGYSSQWRDRIVTGSIVTTEFKKHDSHGSSWFRHK